MKPKLINSDFDFQQALEEFLKNNSIQAMIILMAENNKCNVEIIEPLIKSCKKTIIGGVFPKIIFESKLIDEGVIFIPLKFALKCISFDFNESDDICYNKIKNAVTTEKIEVKSMFMFFDALAHKKDTFIDCIFNFFGTTVKYIGSACGNAKFKQINCVISNAGINQNLAVFAICDEDISLGDSHGCLAISKPYKITAVENNSIKTLNWLPAYEVYQDIVNTHSQIKITDDNFFELSKTYPFGKTKIDGDYTIRHIVDRENNGLKCIDLVETGEYVSVMNTSKDSLLLAAHEALNKTIENLNENTVAESFVFCVDCMSREMNLNTDFQEELNIIAQLSPVYGVLSLGEVANCGDKVLEIYNNMIAIALWK